MYAIIAAVQKTSLPWMDGRDTPHNSGGTSRNRFKMTGYHQPTEIARTETTRVCMADFSLSKRLNGK